MYPALVNALARLSLTSRWSSFTVALSRAAGTSLSSLKQVSDWAKVNKGASALIASAVVEAGLSVAEFLRGDDGKPLTGSRELAVELSKFAKISPDVAKIINDVLAADGDKMKLTADAQASASEAIARCALAYVRDNVLLVGVNGDDVSARMLELHASLQIFTNLPRRDIEELLGNKVSPIPAYDRRVMRPYLLAGI